jgi:hypothetical protein
MDPERRAGTLVWLFLIAVLASSQSNCGGSEPVGPPDGGAVVSCTVQAPTSCHEPAPRYVEVAPIISRRCVPCHYGVPNGPWPLVTYDDVADWQDVIRDDLLDCSMPPPDAGTAMPDEERLAILQWIQCGYRP